jgi:hypothetical protein
VGHLAQRIDLGPFWAGTRSTRGDGTPMLQRQHFLTAGSGGEPAHPSVPRIVPDAGQRLTTVRLEQLVLFGPSDNFSVQFGPRVTVLAGLAEAERHDMMQTLVDAMAGRLPNASVIFVDESGQRVFADRMGATYADTGVAAPSLSELLGTDPTIISDLVTLRAADLGVGEQRSSDDIEDDLRMARDAVEQLAEDEAEATTYVVQTEAMRAELAQLDERIDALPDAIARWDWMGMRNQLDGLRAELAALERSDDGATDGDDQILAAVEELRDAGEAWAEASTIATELGLAVGALPPVSDADLHRVASTPDQLPADFDARVAAVEAAVEATSSCTEALSAATAEPADPEDGIVYQLAQLDQEALWKAHAAAVAAQIVYESELQKHEDETDPDMESEIEAAHHEVVRCQREVDRRFRAGILGPSLLAVGALLAGQTISILVGIPVLATAAALGFWLLAIPRKHLAAAEREEEMALGRADAGSWLGLHLRRIDDVMQPTDRKGLNAAVDRRSSTRLDWEEISGGTSIEAAGEREAATRAYAAAIDPKARAAQVRCPTEALEAARHQEREARQQLAVGLEGYGLSTQGAADLDPAQIRAVLEQRTVAGRFARRAVALQEARTRAASTGTTLDHLLCKLGFDDGDLAGRLERAIVSVEAARRRRQAAEDIRSRDEVEAEIDRLASQVADARRLSWDLTPDPTEAPADPSELDDRRRALVDALDARRSIDVADLQRRSTLAADRVRALEAELSSQSEGPTALRRRVADRIARTTWVGEGEEGLPLIIDDAFVDVDPGELFKLLDLIVRLSNRTQIVLLTSDATIAKWARREATHGIISLLETDGVAVR